MHNMELKVGYALVFAVAAVLCVSGDQKYHKKLIVVLVDGVRWDYLTDTDLKGFRRIMESGVKAPYVIPVFPSLSYPNYYSIVTGLYAENHGFVHNYMYDKDTNSSFTMIPEPGSWDMHWWREAEPVWITAEKNNRSSALYWWAGCEVQLSGIHPTICERQRYGPPTEEEKQDYLLRIDDVLHMFKSSPTFPEARLSLALIYYGAVDYTGHRSGPKSADVTKAIYEIDEILDEMQTKIKQGGLENEVNIMVVSDHGMTDVSPDTTDYISLDKFSSRIKYQVGSGAVSMVFPEDGMLDTLFRELTAEGMTKGINFYRKEELPQKFHIKENERTLPIVLVAKKGYYIKALSDPRRRIGGAFKPQMGSHGFDPEEVKDMRTVFLATGPDFKRGFETEVLYNTDLYNVMCHVLGIQALANNGSWDRAQSMMRPRDALPYEMTSTATPRAPSYHGLACIASIVVFGLLFS